MEPRIDNPAVLLPDLVTPIQQLIKAVHAAGAPATILELVHLRASQINGCSFCVDSAWKTGQKDVGADKLFMVAAWREATCFDDAERAALELAEHVTRLADAADPVPDAVWSAAAEHFTDAELAAIVTWIGVTNLFNRMNAATRQLAGSVTW